MKKQSFKLLTLVFAIFFVVSCSKEPEVVKKDTNTIDGKDGKDGTDGKDATSSSEKIILYGDVTNEEAKKIIANNVGTNTSSISIRNTTKLTSVIFPKLPKALEIKIENNEKLSKVTFLKLKNLFDNLVIKENASLTTVEFPELIKVNNINIHKNKKLKGLSLPKVTELIKNIVIEQNDLLKTIDLGSSVKKKINAELFSIRNNKSLEKLKAGISGKFSNGVIIKGNEMLTEIDFSETNFIDSDSISISNNTKLTTVNFPKMVSFTGFLHIEDKSLKTLNFPKLKKGNIHLGKEEYYYQQTPKPLSLESIILPNFEEGTLEITPSAPTLKTLKLPLFKKGSILLPKTSIKVIILPNCIEANMIISGTSLKTIEMPLFAKGNIDLSGNLLQDIKLSSCAEANIKITSNSLKNIELPLFKMGRLKLSGSSPRIVLPNYSSGNISVSGGSLKEIELPIFKQGDVYIENTLLQIISLPNYTGLGRVYVKNNTMLKAFKAPKMKNSSAFSVKGNKVLNLIEAPTLTMIEKTYSSSSYYTYKPTYAISGKGFSYPVDPPRNSSFHIEIAENQLLTELNLPSLKTVIGGGSGYKEDPFTFNITKNEKLTLLKLPNLEGVFFDKNLGTNYRNNLIRITENILLENITLTKLTTATRFNLSCKTINLPVIKSINNFVCKGLTEQSSDNLLTMFVEKKQILNVKNRAELNLQGCNITPLGIRHIKTLRERGVKVNY